MSFTSWIIERLNRVADAFYWIYIEVYDWPWPFSYTADFFYELTVLFNDMAWDFYNMDSWFQSVQARLDAIVIPTLDDFLELIAMFVPAGLADWFANWTGNVWGLIDSWWDGVAGEVTGWIQNVYDWTAGWIDYLEAEIAAIKAVIAAGVGDLPNLSELMSWFTDWTGNVWGVIDNWWDGQLVIVQSLISAAFVEREALWSGWQDLKSQVADFFSDPDDWLYRAADRIVERFW